MDIKLIRRLLREGSQVVLLEEGHAPLVVRQLRTEEPPEEVPIASRWPKDLGLGRPQNGRGRFRSQRIAEAGRTVFDGRQSVPASDGPDAKQEQVLERLNKEILALKEQIAQEEAEQSNS